MLELPRRKFLIGLTAFLAAPAIIRCTDMMGIKSFIDDWMPAPFGLDIPLQRLRPDLFERNRRDYERLAAEAVKNPTYREVFGPYGTRV